MVQGLEKGTCFGIIVHRISRTNVMRGLEKGPGGIMCGGVMSGLEERTWGRRVDTGGARKRLGVGNRVI